VRRPVRVRARALVPAPAPAAHKVHDDRDAHGEQRGEQRGEQHDVATDAAVGRGGRERELGKLKRRDRRRDRAVGKWAIWEARPAEAG